MRCQDVADAACNSEEQNITDTLSLFETYLLKQQELILRLVLVSTTREQDVFSLLGYNFQQYTWLEYSQAEDAAFCFACRHFVSSESRKCFVFTTNGFRMCKKFQDSDSSMF